MGLAGQAGLTGRLWASWDVGFYQVDREETLFPTQAVVHYFHTQQQLMHSRHYTLSHCEYIA